MMEPSKRYNIVLTKEVLTQEELDELITMLTDVGRGREGCNKENLGTFYRIASTGKEKPSQVFTTKTKKFPWWLAPIWTQASFVRQIEPKQPHPVPDDDNTVIENRPDPQE